MEEELQKIVGMPAVVVTSWVLVVSGGMTPGWTLDALDEWRAARG